MKLEARMTLLEKTITAHLEESGAIRTDLSWLKKAFWTLTGAVLTFCVTFSAGLVLFLLRR